MAAQRIDIYKNGILQNETCDAWLSTSASGRHLRIGYEFTDYFERLIDDFRLYNRPLSASEVEALYEAAG